jgi:hypothetical protein
MRTTRAVRDAMRDAEQAKAGCARCPHLQIQHHELQRELLDVNASHARGEIVMIPNPAYRPLAFHCDLADCGCVVTADG